MQSSGVTVSVPPSSQARPLPLVGILVFGRAPRLHLLPLRLRALAAEALMQGARLVLLNSDDCNPETGRLEGEIWEAGAWVSVSVPLPDVVLVVTNPLQERHRRVDRWIRGAVPVIRDTGPDKLVLPALLTATPLARYVIPQDTVDPEAPAERIEAWMAAHGDCVVKAVDGKRGHGIHRLHAGPGAGWCLRKDGAVMVFPDRATAAAAVAARIAGRLRYRRYIVQRYIVSTSPDGRAADLRLHLQRDGHGAWGVTRRYVRLGEAGQAVSNVSRGGYQGPLDGFLATRRARPAAEITAEADAAALGIAAAIEAAQGHTLSELGVDLALDPDDRLWLIETNTRPQTSLHEHDRAVRTIAYALWLVAGSPAATLPPLS